MYVEINKYNDPKYEPDLLINEHLVIESRSFQNNSLPVTNLWNKGHLTLLNDQGNQGLV